MNCVRVSGETVPALIQYNGKEYFTTKHGNLVDGSDWNQAFGEFLAQQESITLSDEHWVILNFLRKFYFEFGVTPMVRLLMKHLGAAIGKEKVHEEYLYQLFPKGPARQGSRIAGLPEPQGCVD